MTTPCCRRSRRRVALLSAATIALGVLVSAPAGRAATPSVRSQAQATTPPVGRPLLRATTPRFLSQMAQALARMHGYQITLQTASAGYGRPITARSTAIVVRRGRTLRLHLTATTRRVGQVRTREEVLTGTHQCVHRGGRSAWSCMASPRSTLTRLQSMDPQQLALAFGLSQQYVPAGRHTKQGQSCRGYRCSLTARGLHGAGMLWIARTRALPVEEDTVNTLVLRLGAPPLVVRTTQHWSHWNDPHLTIPAVPAS